MKKRLIGSIVVLFIFLFTTSSAFANSTVTVVNVIVPPSFKLANMLNVNDFHGNSREFLPTGPTTVDKTKYVYELEQVTTDGSPANQHEYRFDALTLVKGNIIVHSQVDLTDYEQPYDITLPELDYAKLLLPADSSYMESSSEANVIYSHYYSTTLKDTFPASFFGDSYPGTVSIIKYYAGTNNQFLTSVHASLGLYEP